MLRRLLSVKVALLFITLTFWTLSSSAQERGSVRGIVYAEKDQPLAGASVSIRSTQTKFSTGVKTDNNGAFTASLPVGGPYTFSVSSVGYEPQTVSGYSVKANAVTALTITLKTTAAAMEQVVVVGYGRQKAPTVTGAVGTVLGKDLVQTPVSNITNMLIGRTAGISGVQVGGEPGVNAASIRIRGLATLNGADPLIVIDDIQQPTEQPYTILNAMDANEIETISVLKDAAATAVYGIRGANGVIIVTTKRGRTNRPQFSFSANQGFTKATSLFQTANSYDYALLRNEAVRNAQAAGDFSFNRLLFSNDELWKFQNNRDYTPAQVDAMTNLSAAQKEALKNSPALYYTSHNYYEEQFGGTGLQNQYNLNVSGGTNKIKYFTSLGYFQQAGILANTSYGGANTNPNFKRYNFRSNFDIDIAKNLQLRFNIGGQSSVNRIVGGGSSSFDNRYQSIIQSILENAPFVGPGIIDGKLVTGFVGTVNDTINPLVNKGGTGGTPISALLTGGTRTIYTSNLNTAVTLTHNMGYITSGLEAHARVSYDNSYAKGYVQYNNIPQYTAMRDAADPSKIIYIGGIVNPASTSDNSGNSSWRKVYYEAAINYNRSFGGRTHNITGLLLANAQKYTQTYQSFNAPSSLMGVVGRATYNFRERYLLEFSMAYNGTENFAPGKRFGFFPAVAAGWVISEERFFRSKKVISFAKLRGSYGEVGNDQLGGSRYLYLPNTWVTNAAGYWFGNSNGTSVNPYYAGAVESALGNPNVTWERAKKINISADLRLFSDRLSVTGSYFEEKRNNILWRSGIVPVTFGVSTIPATNLGRVSNKGYEIEAGWNDRIGQVGYFVKGNYSFARNRIDYQAEAPNPYEWMNATGYSIGQYKGLLTDGFYNSQRELNNRPFNTFGGNNARLGDLKFRDVNGDGILDNRDLVPIGYSNLPQVAYNLSVGFSYKGFDINALFIGTAKGSFPEFGYILSTPFAQTRGQVLQAWYDGRWTPEKAANGEAISYPAISFSGGQSNNNVLSDFWLKSNSFQRLKNLEIGYTFGSRTGFLSRANIKGIRVYANGNNLITWGSNLLPGIDPEQADAGKNNMGYLYPLTRTFNLGASVQF